MNTLTGKCWIVLFNILLVYLRHQVRTERARISFMTEDELIASAEFAKDVERVTRNSQEVMSDLEIHFGLK